MLVSKFLERVNSALRGTDDDAPSVGDTEATYWIDLLNRKKEELYQDTSKKWRICYEVRSLGTVTVSASPVYNLDDEFLIPSNNPYVIDTDGSKHELEYGTPQSKFASTRKVYIAGFNPEKLYFNEAIATGDVLVGGTLYVPGYYMPADVEDETDVLPFPDPNWAVMAVASEIAFNDITYEDKAADLNGKANSLYAQMLARNNVATYESPRKSRYNVNRIRNTERR